MRDELPVTDHDHAAMEGVFADAVPDGATRRVLVSRAAKALAIAGGGALLVGALPGTAVAETPAIDNASLVHGIKGVLATFETFGVTFITEAVRRSPGTPSAAFAPVLKSANTEEYLHLQALLKLDAEPLAQSFWIPDALFGKGGATLFRSIERDEDIEISAYLAGVTAFARTGDAFGARLCAEALGTEAVHRALARFAQGQIKEHPEVPNNRGFEGFPYKSGLAAMHAVEALGVGIGKKGNTPGKFYTFPGDPRDNGTGLGVTSTRPS